jgi:hypothetical protein
MEELYGLKVNMKKEYHFIRDPLKDGISLIES